MKSYQESNPFPRGSEWRKWDLHVHAPGGKLNDHYGDSEDVWDEFCRTLEDSEVAAFGITDYFSLTNFFRGREKFEKKYPHSKKILFPNLELRLPDSVNEDGEPVELHIIMRPDLSSDRANTLLAHLTTEVSDGSKRKLPCSELESTAQFESATVTKEVVEKALATAFGPEQVEDPQDYLLVVPANHGGLRCDLGKKRKVEIAVRIDRMTHAVFGNKGNVVHFLDPERSKGKHRLAAKPVLAGSDAHGMEELEAWLGREVEEEGKPQKTVTWIKSDVNFDGLLQIKAEPAGRVRLGAPKPDAKDPYRVIESVRFADSGDFPEQVVLNPNLVAVIGPRSSGKSSLLAHIAYAVDPDYTVAQQEEVEPRPKEVGPAPGKTWRDVEELSVEVCWREPDTNEGKVIYVPQNALHSISQKPDEIAARIEPAVRGEDPAFDTAMRQTEIAVASANEEIELGVADWFEIRDTIDKTETELRDRGDKEAIVKTRDELGETIAAKREESKLSEADAKRYEEVMDEFGKIEGRLAVINEESHQLTAYLERDGNQVAASPAPKVEIRITPSPNNLPDSLRKALTEIAADTEAEVVKKVAGVLVDYQKQLDKEQANLEAAQEKLKKDNSELIERNEANSEIEELSKARRRQEELLEQIKSDEGRLTGLRGEAETIAERLGAVVADREAAVEGLIEKFKSKERERASMQFGIESQFDPELVEQLVRCFNRTTNGPFMSSDLPFDISRCCADPGAFMTAIRDGEQRLKSGEAPQQVAEAVLTTTPKTLFWAEIEGDRIGGFEASSMSPGKQALFALELILDDTDEPWPLLIDQPEDDLDSRSISTQLVNYLIERKSERQIIMVSHDANLVIGADAEQLIVANRHGAKTENSGEQTFDYFSGSLEHTRPRRKAKLALEHGGIREHACDILDGGKEAFQKRKRKYRI